MGKETNTMTKDELYSEMAARLSDGAMIDAARRSDGTLDLEAWATLEKGRKMILDVCFSHTSSPTP